MRSHQLCSAFPPPLLLGSQSMKLEQLLHVCLWGPARKVILQRPRTWKPFCDNMHKAHLILSLNLGGCSQLAQCSLQPRVPSPFSFTRSQEEPEAWSCEIKRESPGAGWAPPVVNVIWARWVWGELQGAGVYFLSENTCVLSLSSSGVKQRELLPWRVSHLSATYRRKG